MLLSGYEHRPGGPVRVALLFTMFALSLVAAFVFGVRTAGSVAYSHGVEAGYEAGMKQGAEYGVNYVHQVIREAWEHKTYIRFESGRVYEVVPMRKDLYRIARSGAEADTRSRQVSTSPEQR